MAKSTDRTLHYVRQCRLFAQLQDTVIQELGKRAWLRTFCRREFVYSPGDLGQSIMILLQGLLRIKDATTHNHEIILTFVEDGDLFGELALLDVHSREEHAEAAKKSLVLGFPREDFLQLLHQHTPLMGFVIALMGRRRQRMEHRLRNVLFLSAR